MVAFEGFGRECPAEERGPDQWGRGRACAFCAIGVLGGPLADEAVEGEGFEGVVSRTQEGEVGRTSLI
ncbi:hypothetical protein GCM10027090_08770 [Sinomonas soli]